MLQYDYTQLFPVFESEAELRSWVAGMKIPADIRQFTYRPDNIRPDIKQVIKLWVILTTHGSGYWRRSVFVAREGVGGLTTQIGITASAQAIMYAQMQIEFDPKRHRVRVYGQPHYGDFGYPHATLLLEYCFGVDI